MQPVWFVLVALMLTVYVILDGFDLGAGIIHLLVGKTDRERRVVLRSIGPVWDGNEVWLLAAGGTLYCMFPVLYAASFSGFYLPLMMVLWLLMLRGMGIELRGHIENPMWHSFWDVVFAASSTLLAIFLGAALGNVIRGVPLNAEGYFFEPLWTNFQPGTHPGILDWYTILAGLVAFVSLTAHGAAYVAAKTLETVNERARQVGLISSRLLILLTPLSLAATLVVRPTMLDNYRAHWWGLVFPMLVVGGLAGLEYFWRAGKDGRVFLSSTTYLVGMLGGAAFGLFPTVLPASTDVAHSLTIYNASTGDYGLSVGLIWWCIGMLLASGYFTYLYRSFQGKVSLEDSPDSHG